MFLHTLTSNITDAVYITDESYRFMYVNDVACNTLGYTNKEMLTMGIEDIDPNITKEKLAWLKDTYHSSFDQNVQLQSKHKTKSGQIIDVFITTSPFEFNGKYRISIIKNVTEKRRLEYEHTLLKFAFDNNQECAFLTDESGSFLYINKALSNILGYSEDELLKMKVFDVNSKISSDKWPKHWETLKTVGSLNFESHCQTKEGQIISIEISANYFEFYGKGYNVGIAKDITKRTDIQNKLIQSEWEYRSLANNVPDNIARWDTEGHYIYLNEAHLKTMNIQSVDEILGKTLKEFNPKAVQAINAIESIKNGEQNSVTIKEDMLNPNGKLEIHEVKFIAEKDKQGKLTSILGVGRNMTEHYKMQETIKSQQKLYHFLAENIPANIVLWDKDIRHFYINDRLEKIVFKTPKEDILGKTIDEAFSDGRFDDIKNLVLQVIKTKKSHTSAKIPILTNEKQIGFYDLHIIPQLDLHGDIQSILGVGLDMTEHYKLQEEIGAKKRQLKFTIETLPGVVGIFHLKTNRTISIPYISPNTQSLFGYKAKTFMKNIKKTTALLDSKNSFKLKRDMIRSLRTMTPWHEEYQINHPRKKERWIEIHAKPMLDPQEGVMWFGYMHDVTEHKSYEKQIGLASIGELSAGITHEINTPLTYIKGRLELMRYHVDNIQDEKLQNKFIRNLTSIHEGVIRMSLIVQSMRELAGKTKDDKEKLDIYQSFITALIMLHNRAKYIAPIYINKEKFTLDMNTDKNTYMSFVNKQRLEQVWIIIINNALDALEHDYTYDKSFINIMIKATDDTIFVTIEDSAGGIADEWLTNMFEPFSSTKEHGGMGLGLSIAKKIIDDQNGTIKVKNGDKGAIFTITLPKVK